VQVDSRSWLQTVLHATPGEQVGGGRPEASVTLGTGRLITVVLAWSLTTTTAINRILVSTDDGATFTSHPAGPPFHILGVAFTDALHGFSVSGPTGAFSHLYRTADGGASWTPIANPIHAETNQQLEFSSPTPAGRSLQLPATIAAATGAQQVSIYTSVDRGRSFATANSPLRIPARFSAGANSVAVLGRLAWVPARGVLDETSNGGRSWSTIRTATHPTAITLIDAAHAIGTITDDGCRHFKSACFDHTYLAATSDGGRTWQAI
jgi:photosystem II stability/assembly factor-like uncharacterized protein